MMEMHDRELPLLLLPGIARGIRATANRTLAGGGYGWLLSPARTMTRQGLWGLRYAVDNEVFTGRFERGRFTRALERIKAAHGLQACLFVVAPDVVADARATMERFAEWGPLIRKMGFPVALALQDGMEELTVPWGNVDAVFVGGSTVWKMGEAAAGLMWEARERGKWVHAGRVSSWLRYDQFRVNPDSVDGTHWVKRPDKYFQAWHRELMVRRHNRRFGFFDQVPEWAPEGGEG